MLNLRLAVLSLVLGLAPASAIVTSPAQAEESPTASPTPASFTQHDMLDSLKDARTKLLAARDGRQAELGTPEAALKTLQQKWKNAGRGDLPAAMAKDVARTLSEAWTKHAKHYRAETFDQPLAVLDAALARDEKTPFRPAEFAALEAGKIEWTARFIALNRHLNTQIALALDEIDLLHDVETGKIPADAASIRRNGIAQERLADLEALGTTRQAPIYAHIGVDGKFSHEPAALADEPSGTVMEVLYWRFAQRQNRLAAETKRRAELETRLNFLCALFPDTSATRRIWEEPLPEDLAAELGIADRTPDVGIRDRRTDARIRIATWESLDELAAVDARQAKLALSVARLRADLWKEAREAIGRIDAASESWTPNTEWLDRRSDLLETALDELLALEGARHTPARARQDLNRNLKTVLEIALCDRMEKAMEGSERAKRALGVADGSFDAVRAAMKHGNGLAAFSTLAKDGTTAPVLGTGAWLIATFFAETATDAPKFDETYLVPELVNEALKAVKANEHPALRFYSTPEARKFDTDAAPMDERTFAVFVEMLQVERLVRALGPQWK